MTDEQMHEKLKISVRMTMIQRTYASAEELIREAGGEAARLGYAEEGFVEDVIAREKEYPTGLNAVMPIAIPHVSSHCKESFMAVVTLKEPLAFEPMDGLGGSLPVEIVFLFGLVNHRDQVNVLKRLAQMFKDKEALQQLKDAQQDAQGCALMQDYLGELVEVV